jgi:hypothetical protein
MLFGSKKNYLTVVGSTVTGFDEYNCSDGVVTVPENVTAIGRGAFSDSSMGRITLPRSLVRIDAFAFSRVRGLSEITIPSGVRRIEEGTFSGCEELRRIVLPSGITYIGESAFCDCSSLTSITLPSGIREICAATFERCYSLTSLTIPSGVEFIRAFAFAHTGLRSLVIPRSVHNIALDGLFAGCDDLTSLTLPSGFAPVVHRLGLSSRCRVSYH